MASENKRVSPEQQKKIEGQGGEKRAAQLAGEERRAKGGDLSRRESRFPALRGADLWTMSPFSLMRRMMSDFDRMFEELGMGGMLPRAGEEPSEALERGALWSPQVDVFEREGNLVVRADLPGLTKDDRVEVRDDALVIEGERRREQPRRAPGSTARSAATARSGAPSRCRRAQARRRPTPASRTEC